METTNSDAISDPFKKEAAPSLEVESSVTSDSSPSTSTPSAPPASLSPRSDKILHQVEFYFSDSNLPQDNFLRGLYQFDPDNYVDLSVIAGFKRMRELLTNGVSDLVAALQHSTTLKLDSTQTRVTRVDPLPDHLDTRRQSIFAAGFPPSHTDIDSITQFFTDRVTELHPEQRNAVRCVRLRRNTERQLDGTALIEFANNKFAQEIVAAAPFQLVVPNSSSSSTTSTTTTTEAATTTAPSNDDEKATVKPATASGATTDARSCTNGTSQPSATPAVDSTNNPTTYTITVQSKMQWLKQFHTDKDTNKHQRGNKRKRGRDNDDDTKEEQKDGDAEAEQEKSKEDAAAADESRGIVPDLLVCFDTVNTESTTRESLKDYVVKAAGVVVYVDYSKGESTAVVRLAEDSPTKASTLVSNLQVQKTELDGMVPVLRAMSGEEERTYWKTVWARVREMKERRQQENAQRGSGRGRGKSRGKVRRMGSRGANRAPRNKWFKNQ